MIIIDNLCSSTRLMRYINTFFTIFLKLAKPTKQKSERYKIKREQERITKDNINYRNSGTHAYTKMYA